MLVSVCVYRLQWRKLCVCMLVSVCVYRLQWRKLCVCLCLYVCIGCRDVSFTIIFLCHAYIHSWECFRGSMEKCLNYLGVHISY